MHFLAEVLADVLGKRRRRIVEARSNKEQTDVDVFILIERDSLVPTVVLWSNYLAEWIRQTGTNLKVESTLEQRRPISWRHCSPLGCIRVRSRERSLHIILARLDHDPDLIGMVGRIQNREPLASPARVCSTGQHRLGQPVAALHFQGLLSRVEKGNRRQRLGVVLLEDVHALEHADLRRRQPHAVRVHHERRHPLREPPQRLCPVG